MFIRTNTTIGITGSDSLMASTLPELDQEITPPTTEKSELPDATALQDQMPDWFRTPKSVALYALILGLMFWVLSLQHLWHTDIWGHLSYGRYIAEHGIPSTEPLMNLSQGMPFVDTAWLSQLVGFKLYDLLGPTVLQFLYALSITVCLALLVRRIHSRTRSVFWSLLGLGLCYWLEFQQFLIPRPQLAGLACFITLFTILTSVKWRNAYFIAVPLLFALWVNLHGSFVMGLFLLGIFCVGQAFDVFRRTRKIGMALQEASVVRSFILLEFAVLASLLNPYGLRIYSSVLKIAQHPNLRALVEWEPITLRDKQGIGMLVITSLLMLCYRYSPRRVRTFEVLSLFGLGVLALWTSRMILWWAPLAVYYAMIHGYSAYHYRAGKTLYRGPAMRSSLWTVVTLGLVWIFFAASHFGSGLIGKKHIPLKQTVSSFTPVDVVQYLHENPPVGQVFNTFEWGDYLLWAGPKGMKVFAASHAHLIPREVWQAYFAIANRGYNWSGLLDLYSVNTIILEIEEHANLISSLKRDNENWRVGYQDRYAIVLIRRVPLR